MEEIKTLDLYIDPKNPMENTKEMVKIIRPDWNTDNIAIKDMSTGYVNRNLRVYIPGNNESLFLRLVPADFEESFVNNYKHVSGFIHQENLGPKVFCNIKNGLCVQYLSGKTMTWNERRGMYDDDFWPRTADMLAFWHREELYERARQYGVIDKAGRGPPPVVLGMMDMLKQSQPDSEFCKTLPSSSEYAEAATWMAKTLATLCPKKAFSHMDANPTNWMQMDNGGLVLIDYDVSAINYVAVELGWFFLLHGDWRKLDLTEYPSEEYRRKWLRRYLSKRHELDGKDAVTDEDVDKLYEEVEIGRLAGELQAVFAGIAVTCATQKQGDEAVTPHTILVPWADFKKRRAELERKGYK